MFGHIKAISNYIQALNTQADKSGAKSDRSQVRVSTLEGVAEKLMSIFNELKGKGKSDKSTAEEKSALVNKYGARILAALRAPRGDASNESYKTSVRIQGTTYLIEDKGNGIFISEALFPARYIHLPDVKLKQLHTRISTSWGRDPFEFKPTASSPAPGIVISQSEINEKRGLREGAMVAPETVDSALQTLFQQHRQDLVDYHRFSSDYQLNAIVETCLMWEVASPRKDLISLVVPVQIEPSEIPSFFAS